MIEYWTSKKKNSVISERREQLDQLFQFANTDLKDDESDQLLRQFYDVMRSIATEHQENFPDLLNTENDILLYGLQKHLCARLKKIIHNTDLLWEMPLWRIGGAIELTMDAKEKRFYERVCLRKMKPENKLKALKRIVDLALMEIVRDLDLKPNWFCQCPRCESFFYQPTKRKKVYCSIRCGDAVRLKKIRRERRKVQGEKPE
jgi:hypothetical protein